MSRIDLELIFSPKKRILFKIKKNPISIVFLRELYPL